jgi:c-di-GMP-binding flagellar brake protein YcgR
MEEYFSANRLFELEMGSVVHVNIEGYDFNFVVRLVGIDQGKLIITTLPAEHTIPEGDTYDTIFELGHCLEMKIVHDGKVIAFESIISDLSFQNSQLLIGSFPEMVECRRIRSHNRYPCILSCDIRYKQNERTGLITDISRGGCHMIISTETKNSFLGTAMKQNEPTELEIYFPFSEDPAIIETTVKSFEEKTPKGTQVGLAFVYDYPTVQKYMDSLRLESISNFFN